ncbi:MULTISPECIES: DUF1190 domain-containing protein [unclassified Pseudomonas]|uniref:DUF1190 domain-containing protein n=1 Tax=unclassified Pseudomonas TaxID=196821 RepID=UPI00382AE5E8
MKRSSLKLVLAGSLPLALSACGPQEELYTVSQKVKYDTVAACVGDNVPSAVCADAYQQAQGEYQRLTPTFAFQSECEAQFGAGNCQATVGGRFIPRMNGFELESAAEVTQSQLDAGYAQGGGYGHVASAAVAGILLGQMARNSDRRFRAQPLYANRSGAGLGPRTGALGGIQRAKEDEQGSSGSSSGGGGGGGSWSRKEPRPASSASITRGGFGSQATARSGWGGRSGSFFGG